MGSGTRGFGSITTGQTNEPAVPSRSRSNTMSSMTATGLLERLRGQDLLLFGWVALGWPLLSVLVGGGEQGLSAVFDDGQPLRGLVWLLAVIGAFVVIGTRNVEDAPDPRPLEERLSLYGPLFGGVLL